MKKYLVMLLGLFLFSSFGVSYLQTKTQAAEEEGLAADFKLQDLDGQSVTLSEYRGSKPVLLFFWTTWCPFCRKELKILKEKYPNLKNEGWEFFAVDVGEPLSRVQSFAKTNILPFRILLDKNTAVTMSYDILGVPTYVFVNKEGRIVFTDNYFPKDYKDLIAK